MKACCCSPNLPQIGHGDHDPQSARQLSTAGKIRLAEDRFRSGSASHQIRLRSDSRLDLALTLGSHHDPDQIRGVRAPSFFMMLAR